MSENEESSHVRKRKYKIPTETLKFMKEKKLLYKDKSDCSVKTSCEGTQDSSQDIQSK